MARDGPHRLAFFSLVPLNDRAWEVLNHPENTHLVSGFRDYKGPGETLYGLEIGLHIRSKSRYTLATLGRSGDIIVEGAGISRIHCSFEMHEGNKEEIMLQDRSANRSTRFFGGTAMSFEEGRRHRRVVVDRNVNLQFGFGGVAGSMYQFHLVWHPREKLATHVEDREDHPRATRTVLEEPQKTQSIAPSQPTTRIHTPRAIEKVRYSRRKRLGKGAFGEVWKVANIDSGEYLAVKKVKRPPLMSRSYVVLKREVETLARVSHRNIVEYRAAQWGEDYFDIIMELKPGNVQNLVLDGMFLREPRSANPFLGQMLQALDYLTSKEIIHRDVKPENILYTPSDGGYLYQLADFGLANLVADAHTFAGTGLFMAPELENGKFPQTPKMDVWSLFVTLVYAMNGAGFRDKPLHTSALLIQAVQEAADHRIFKPLRAMAVPDPEQRATAGDMLDQIFNGEGRTTLRKQTLSPAAPNGQGEVWRGLLEQSVEPESSMGSAERRFREAVDMARSKRSKVVDRALDTMRPSAPDSVPHGSPSRGVANVRRPRNMSQFPGSTPHEQRPGRF